MPKVVIDLSPKSAKTMIVSKLRKLKTTVEVVDHGEYHFPAPTGWHKIILETTKTEKEVEDWLYKLTLPKLNFEYGTAEVDN